MTSVTLYHSAWRNAAHALLWTLIALGLWFKVDFETTWWAAPCFALLALAAAALWRRAFDRSLLARVDEQGIWTRRFGLIGWADIADAGVEPGQASYLWIVFRNVEPWKSRAGLLQRTLHGRIRPAPFSTTLPLQHTGVDETALHRTLQARMAQQQRVAGSALT